MTHRYHDIAFTPAVLRMQSTMGSRDVYASMDGSATRNHRLTAREAQFIAERDSFYMASVSETGWPYLQHRGGPPGFMKVLGPHILGFADYSGNRQYVSTGNFTVNDKVSLFFMDYPNRRRLKLFGRVEVVTGEAVAQLADHNYAARVERGLLVHVEGFDWNCPRHITRRYSETEIRNLIPQLQLQSKE